MRKMLLLTMLCILAFGCRQSYAETAPKIDKKPAASSDSESDALYKAMQERYKKMAQQMEKLRQTKDPAERQKLMQEHWQTMHEGMGTMRGAMGPGMMMGGGMMGPGMGMGAGPGMGAGMGPRGAMRGGPFGTNCPAGNTPEATTCRQQHMEQRMDMMQMMMDQMIEHQGQAAPSR